MLLDELCSVSDFASLGSLSNQDGNAENNAEQKMN